MAKDILTPREHSILKLVAEGKSNNEIATVLSISSNTVKDILSKIYKKIEIHDRVQLSIWALRNGFID